MLQQFAILAVYMAAILIGAVVHATATNTRAQDLGKIIFGCGLLALLLDLRRLLV